MIYILEQPTSTGGTWWYKIGNSRDPVSRAEHYRSCNPEISLLDTREGDSLEASILHKYFRLRTDLFVPKKSDWYSTGSPQEVHKVFNEPWENIESLVWSRRVEVLGINTKGDLRVWTRLSIGREDIGKEDLDELFRRRWVWNLRRLDRTEVTKALAERPDLIKPSEMGWFREDPAPETNGVQPGVDDTRTESQAEIEKEDPGIYGLIGITPGWLGDPGNPRPRPGKAYLESDLDRMDQGWREHFDTDQAFMLEDPRKKYIIIGNKK